MLDQGAFREVMGTFPTGVTVVTSVASDGTPLGLTVSAFTSVSLTPPLALVCIDRGSSSHDPLVAAGSFAVNILSADQGALARRFAVLPGEERFQDVPWRPGPNGAPVLADVAAWLCCSLEAVHPGGDHSILVGRVEDLEARAIPALLYHRGMFGALDL